MKEICPLTAEHLRECRATRERAERLNRYLDKCEQCGIDASGTRSDVKSADEFLEQVEKVFGPMVARSG